ncbi:hypothetical protein ACR79S_19295 [Sphingobacterium spiritivorum]|uniref:hypothetical protein n=1 Tax=Sphingobacterium spiritivorum TaxID=258 RepID=UPI003DA5EAB3
MSDDASYPPTDPPHSMFQSLDRCHLALTTCPDYIWIPQMVRPVITIAVIYTHIAVGHAFCGMDKFNRSVQVLYAAA